MAQLTEKEYEAIQALNAEYRQAMFMRAAKEADGFYILADNDGPLILEDTEEDDEHNLYSILPVWSHEELAAGYAKNNGMDSFKPQFVTKQVWNEKWVPAFKDQPNVLIGFMPISDKDFSVESPMEI